MKITYNRSDPFGVHQKLRESLTDTNRLLLESNQALSEDKLWPDSARNQLQ